MLVGIWVPLVQIIIPLNKWILSIVMGVLSIFFALLLGYVWDKTGLWKSETKQNVERNVAYINPTKKEREMLVPLQLETARVVAEMSGDKKLKKKIKEVENWLSA